MKQPLRAAENFECVDKLGKSSPDSLAALGDIYLIEGLNQAATDAYKRMVAKDPNQALGKVMRSLEMLLGRGLNSEAGELMKQVHAVSKKLDDPKDRPKLLKLEGRLAIANGRATAETIKVLEEVVALDPLDGEALLLLGQQYSNAKQDDRAIMQYERAASLEAFELRAKSRHGQLLVKLGKHREALPLLRRAQEIRPRDDMARYIEQVERQAKMQK